MNQARKNEYPFIFVHGFNGYGDQGALSIVCPYYGTTTGDAPKLGRAMGFKTAAPDLAAFGTAWERACELYARIVGGRVDYGKVHAERFGMDRYGKFCDGCYPEWGTKDENGNIRKVNFIGHSFGGPTVRILIELLANGNKEERDATDPDDLSPLFKGGKDNWIHSFTSLAATHEGTSLMTFFEQLHLIDYLATAMGGLVTFLGDTPFEYFFPVALEHHHFKDANGKWDKKKLREFGKGGNTCLHNMTVTGGHEMLKGYKPNNKIYYFSYAACRTHKLGNLAGNIQMPDLKIFPGFFTTAPIMGLYTNKKTYPEITNDWHAGDGCVNIMSAAAPVDDPQEFYKKEGQSVRPGVWYKMPVEYGKDHMSYMGMGEKKKAYNDFFISIFERVSALSTID